MKTLFLVRHTTPDISAGICYGQLDIDLNSGFDDEAAEVSNRLPSLELIVTSPLLRTRRLAEHLAQVHQCELRSDPLLLEMHFGDWEGKKWDDIARHEIDVWSADILNCSPPNGESAQQMMNRVQKVLHEVAQLPQQNIALVGHGGGIRALLALLGDVELVNTLVWKIEFGAVIWVRI